ncbi:MAG: hypothetical protein KAF91_09795 [Nostoc sp. TH1S01]|nr:hypothetical protein [Nostoc sp. TH1S01]
MLYFSVNSEDISRLSLLLIASQVKLGDRTPQTSKYPSKPNSDPCGGLRPCYFQLP